MQLIFVCSGNTCRSPLAWAAWQVALREAEPSRRAVLDGVEVHTAGLNARAGAPVTEAAQYVTANWKVDLSAHRARQWQPVPADLIVAMTADQVAQIRVRLEARADQRGDGPAPRVEALGFYAPAANWWLPWKGNARDLWRAEASAGDVLDPYGGSREAYEECGKRILRGVRALAEALCHAP